MLVLILGYELKITSLPIPSQICLLCLALFHKVLHLTLLEGLWVSTSQTGAARKVGCFFFFLHTYTIIITEPFDTE